MKISLILILFFSFLFQNNISKERLETKTEGIITYSHKPLGAKKPFEKYLHFDKNGAWYAHQQEKETVVTEQGYNYYYFNEKENWYYQNDSVYFFRERENYPNYYARWKAKEIEWEITNETKTIAGFNVTKAIAKAFKEESKLDSYEYRGKAIAWFTTDVPLSYGPDGYEGLPGLIVKLQYENYDDTYITTLKNIEYKEIDEWKIPSTEKRIEVERSDAYNPWKLGKKWFKQKAKEMGID